MSSLLKQQVEELKKWNFTTLYAIARSKEPLTYSLEIDKNEHQVEAFFTKCDEKELHMVVALDSDGKGRFSKSTGSEVEEVVIEK